VGGVIPREGLGPLLGDGAGLLLITDHETVVPKFRAESVGTIKRSRSSYDFRPAFIEPRDRVAGGRRERT